jgi:TolB-like protein/tetratricopeptide (TPR) repeat protein/tRNA A-37 threonylcarbamoyl transferase component Bud32
MPAPDEAVTVPAAPAARDGSKTLDRLQSLLQGRYSVERELGRGGMAIVYLATDARHGRRVAIKVMRPELGFVLGLERFLREIQILATLTHPHILPLHDSGGDDELLYYVMPFVEGESLRQRLKRDGTLAPADAVRMTRGVALALDYAHRRGVIHRDIKPENILLVDGEPVLADFGIALTTGPGDEGERLTQGGLSLGTPVYMSPEQALGDPTLDGRSDLYAVGCVLHEMLSGAPPYGGGSFLALTAQKLSVAVPSLGAGMDAVSPALREILTHLLHRDPAARYTSAAQLVEALDRAGDGPRQTGAEPVARATPVSVAVLPFLNRSLEPDNEFFSDGMSEELTLALARVDGLRVVARASAFAFKSANIDPREIGRRLGVTHVLEGSVRRAGDRVRITSELIATRDGARVWADRYDRRLDDVFAVQDEIARTIVDVLAVRLDVAAPASAPKPATASPEAYESYLKGRHRWNRRTASALDESIDCFHHAIELDPGFARAHAGLADSYLILGIYGLRPPATVMREAEHAARVALRLDPDLAEALTARGCVRGMYAWDWTGADADFRHAIALNPGYPTARQWYAMHCLVPRGRFAEAEAQLTQALALDPLSPAIQASLGVTCLYARQLERSRDILRQVLASDESFALAHFFLGRVAEAEGRQADAIAGFTRAAELTGRSAEVIAALARARAAGGDLPGARALHAELEQRALASEYVSPALFAQVHLGYGAVDEAMTWLERAVETRAGDVAWLAVNPAFDGLRDDPRFQAMRTRVGVA